MNFTTSLILVWLWGQLISSCELKAAQVASLHKARHNGGGYEYNACKYDCLIEIRYDVVYKSWPIFCFNIYNKLLEEFF